MNFSEYRLILSAGQTRSVNKCTDSLPIPKDLVMEIFSRLPAKSVSRYRFLSDFWSFVFHSQYFLDLFTAKSSARPQILFAHINKAGFSFFSAQQPSENSCDNLLPTHLTHGSIYGRVSRPINGLVCISGFNDGSESVICNPSTEDFLSLPKKKTKGRYPNVRNFLGYDPTNKQFKVLSLRYSLRWDWGDSRERPEIVLEHQVLTLENNEELSWRKIECYKHHYPIGSGEICINGVLYYHAIGLSRVQLIVCFDVRSETFRFMIVKDIFKEDLHWTTVFTNYNGKLSLLVPEESNHLITGETLGFEIWILEDARKQWLKHVYLLPPTWKDVVGDNELKFVGMIGTNGIILSSSYRHFGVHVHPYIFFYNIEKNTIRRVDIQGMKASGLKKAYMFLNHVEGLSFDIL